MSEELTLQNITTVPQGKCGAIPNEFNTIEVGIPHVEAIIPGNPYASSSENQELLRAGVYEAFRKGAGCKDCVFFEDNCNIQFPHLNRQTTPLGSSFGSKNKLTPLKAVVRPFDENDIRGNCGAIPNTRNNISKEIGLVEIPAGRYSRENSDWLKDKVRQTFVNAVGCSSCQFQPDCKIKVRSFQNRLVENQLIYFGTEPLEVIVTPGNMKSLNKSNNKK